MVPEVLSGQLFVRFRLNMGGAVSSGRDNDEIVDNLIDAGYIVSKNVEEVFRAVDRGAYYTESCRRFAYQVRI